MQQVYSFSAYVIPGLMHKYSQLPKSFKDPQVIIDTTLKHFAIPKEKATSKTRKREVVQARQVCMTFLKMHTPLSLEKIGDLFYRDHTTVMHAIQTIKDLTDVDTSFRKDIEQIYPLNW